MNKLGRDVGRERGNCQVASRQQVWGGFLSTLWRQPAAGHRGTDAGKRQREARGSGPAARRKQIPAIHLHELSIRDPANADKHAQGPGSAARGRGCSARLGDLGTHNEIFQGFRRVFPGFPGFPSRLFSNVLYSTFLSYERFIVYGVRGRANARRDRLPTSQGSHTPHTGPGLARGRFPTGATRRAPRRLAATAAWGRQATG
jgi:hypothetical protein